MNLIRSLLKDKRKKLLILWADEAFLKTLQSPVLSPSDFSQMFIIQADFDVAVVHILTEEQGGAE